jgi:hypothetical protein
MSYLERQAALKAELGFVLHPGGSEYYGYQGDATTTSSAFRFRTYLPCGRS